MTPSHSDTPNDSITLASIENGLEVGNKLEEPPIHRVATEPITLERWNEPRINLYRYLSALYSFIVLGMNDAAYGIQLETYYDQTYTTISLIFLSPLVGYTLAAFLNNRIHNRFGQFGIAIITPLCKLAVYVITCFHPPYPVLPVIFVLAGFASGLQDGAWNAWIGNMKNANELLGILHGTYGLGATISPLVATAMITKGDLPWYKFYYVMVGMAVLELVVCGLSFRRSTGANYRSLTTKTTDASAPESNTKEVLKTRATWICAFFLLCLVGIEVSLGGWLVTFMLVVRHGAPFASGLVATGFWLGLTFGRIVLGFITGKIGEKLAITFYVVMCMTFELCFWLIPSFISSAVFAGWLGFFLGPLFPAAIVALTKLLPKRLHISAIGFAAAFGGGGAALFPFAVGATAQAKGVKVLQPIALGLLAAMLGLWCLLPGGFRKEGLNRVQQEREKRERAGGSLNSETAADVDQDAEKGSARVLGTSE
ncbi:Major facilitator superfamily domain general substrate transporter protein [Rutstroemia sp. NJR-2017a BVV2]|nr:Major facilitator superfamily domain general substrate transporter protein [Rutstroemia sp. NJR-2017a BVV2]